MNRCWGRKPRDSSLVIGCRTVVTSLIGGASAYFVFFYQDTYNRPVSFNLV